MNLQPGYPWADIYRVRGGETPEPTGPAWGSVDIWDPMRTCLGDVGGIKIFLVVLLHLRSYLRWLGAARWDHQQLWVLQWKMCWIQEKDLIRTQGERNCFKRFFLVLKKTKKTVWDTFFRSEKLQFFCWGKNWVTCSHIWHLYIL